MRFSLKTLLWGVLLIAVVLFAAMMLFPKPVEVEFATAKIGPLRVAVQEDGKTRIREKYTVSAPLSGRVSRIELNPGDHCDEKTLLAVILPSAPEFLDARALAQALAKVQASEAAVQRAQSNLEQARIQLELSQTKFERAQELLPSNAISQNEFDIARTEQMSSEQSLQTARFELEIARYELAMAKAAVQQFDADAEQGSRSLDPFEIDSPISGRVLRVMQESSAVVSVGTPLIQIGDPSNLEIEVDVLSTDAVQIQPGAEVLIKHWGGAEPLSGYVRVIEPAAFTKVSSLGVEEQRVNVIADFSEPPEQLASLGDGYRVEASITVDVLEQALQIPNSALFRHQRQWHVLSIVDNKAHLQPVKIGLQSDAYTQVTEGLNAGARVIVYPSDAITPGTPVRLAGGGS